MSFKVDECSLLLSDVYCPITFSLAALENDCFQSNNNKEYIKRRNNEKANEFKLSLK